jgi:hypothetical protein
MNNVVVEVRVVEAIKPDPLTGKFKFILKAY